MIKKSIWKQVAESYPCYTCGAGPGDPCLTYNGKKAELPHASRTTQARKNDWKFPEEGS